MMALAFGVFSLAALASEENKKELALLSQGSCYSTSDIFVTCPNGFISNWGKVTVEIDCITKAYLGGLNVQINSNPCPSQEAVSNFLP